ncbi:hypothetical protein SDC9_81967 [bioreactor metagenome]|uniref:Peptidase S11 D-Ala-D-Ala carboxypeptidase A C-terminal domain-containing protein n=1 Tax=bioreactor metagenome TaxID=1076179 RepID=A0A644Z3E6_9ZZZZ
MRVISAVFKDTGTDVYVDSRTLIDYAFDNYYTQTIINKADYTKSKRIIFTKEKELLYEPEFNYKIVLEKGSKASENYNAEVNLDYDLPIKKGDTVGTLDVYNGKTLEKTINLVAKNDLNSVFGFITENTTVKYPVRLALASISLFIIFIMSRIIKKRKARRKKITR